MSGRNRHRRPGRREPFRDPRPIVLIVCEGSETEKQYFEKFALHHKNARVRVEVADQTGVPFSLVEFAKRQKRASDKKARRQKDQNIAYDSVWCVFDVDEHPRIADARVMAAAHDPTFRTSRRQFLRISVPASDRPRVRQAGDLAAHTSIACRPEPETRPGTTTRGIPARAVPFAAAGLAVDGTHRRLPDPSSRHVNPPGVPRLSRAPRSIDRDIATPKFPRSMPVNFIVKPLFFRHFQRVFLFNPSSSPFVSMKSNLVDPFLGRLDLTILPVGQS